MALIPNDKSLESSLALLQEGFPFIQNRCRRLGTDIFQTRMMFQKAICISGKEAAKVFYDPNLFERKKAVPKRIQKTLLGEKGVQVLDSVLHQHRKGMFMSIMNSENIKLLLQIMRRHWQSSLKNWGKQEKVTLFDETQDILCKTACEWVGIPLAETEVRSRAKDFWAMVDAFGAIGPRHWRGRRARKRAEKWIGSFVDQVRNNRLDIDKNTPAYTIINHKTLNGKYLDPHTTSVEIINLLRPIVAISNYITFAALAIYENPVYLRALRKEDGKYIEYFVQEVRRFYPFAPFTGARVKHDFEWRGFKFPKGRLVFLDIYGTNHDPRIWERPDEFWPDHFRFWNRSPYSFIPQGGGEYSTGHRCAGEWITIESMKLAVEFLVNYMEYEVPEQDLDYPLSRIPSVVKSGFVISQIKEKLPVTPKPKTVAENKTVVENNKLDGIIR